MVKEENEIKVDDMVYYDTTYSEAISYDAIANYSESHAIPEYNEEYTENKAAVSRRNKTRKATLITGVLAAVVTSITIFVQAIFGINSISFDITETTISYELVIQFEDDTTYKIYLYQNNEIMEVKDVTSETLDGEFTQLTSNTEYIIKVTSEIEDVENVFLIKDVKTE